MPASPKTLGMDKSESVLPHRGKRKRKADKSVLSEDEEPMQTWTPKDADMDPERETKILQKMETCIQKLENSQLWSSLLNQMRGPEFLNRISNSLGAEASMKMVIYGIGSIESYEPPRLQLGVAILMKKSFGWIGDIEVYDPIISLAESNVLAVLGCSVLSFNEKCRRQALRPTFFFMPHCTDWLYNNLLQANWGQDMLNRIVILGNSFEKYERHKSSWSTSTIAKSRKHISAVRKYTKEVRVIVKFDMSNYFRAFNSTSWHFFCLDSEPDSLI